MKLRALVAFAPVLLLQSLSPSVSHADSSVAEDLLNNLYAMKGVYRAQYAPAEWKRKYAGYDLDAEFARATQAIRPDMSVKEAQRVLQDFIYAMRDYHTSIQFFSTEASTLPFVAGVSEDRFFIVYIDRAKLPEASFPFHVGDELMTFDGKAVKDVVLDLAHQYIENVPATDLVTATLNLTKRRAARGLAVPKGPVTIGVKPKGGDRIIERQLVWNYAPERIAPRRVGLRALTAGTSGLLHPQMTVQFGDPAGAVETPFDIGARKTFTPDLGVKVWETSDDNSFYAYIYKTPDRKLIGYVRIAGYIMPDYEKALADFGKIIERFESTTDSMVIDQVNNPGGSVFYLYALASMLTAEPLKTPLHRMSIIQSDVNDALGMIEKLESVKNDDDAKKAFAAKDELDGYPASYEFAQFSLNYARFLVSEWEKGHRLSDPYWIGGVDHINPAATHYTKPILLLTNHMDFSGGDFFPAILQDNHRVKILGSRTAGAGGYVQDVHVPNNLGVSAFRVTASIAERVDGNPIENLGIRPDIEYELTAEDFTSGFAPYVKAIQAAASDLAR